MNGEVSVVGLKFSLVAQITRNGNVPNAINFVNMNILARILPRLKRESVSDKVIMLTRMKKYNIEYHKLGKVIQLSGGEQELECAICNKKITDSPKNRVRVTVGDTSCVPKTWSICLTCFEGRVA